MEPGSGPGEAERTPGHQSLGGVWWELGVHSGADLRTKSPRPRQGSRTTWYLPRHKVRLLDMLSLL